MTAFASLAEYDKTYGGGGIGPGLRPSLERFARWLDERAASGATGEQDTAWQRYYDAGEPDGFFITGSASEDGRRYFDAGWNAARGSIVANIRARVTVRQADHAASPHPHNEQNTEVLAGVADSIERRRF